MDEHLKVLYTEGSGCSRSYQSLKLKDVHNKTWAFTKFLVQTAFSERKVVCFLRFYLCWSCIPEHYNTNQVYGRLYNNHVRRWRAWFTVKCHFFKALRDWECQTVFYMGLAKFLNVCAVLKSGFLVHFADCRKKVHHHHTSFYSSWQAKNQMCGGSICCVITFCGRESSDINVKKRVTETAVRVCFGIEF